LPGGRYQFKATTDLPAKSVTLIIAGKRHAMQGSGTKWELSKKLAKRGAIEFSMSAANKEGVEGPANGGVVVVEARPVNVVAVQISPEAVYPGEEFVIRAQTDSPARAVDLQMDGLSYTMKGSGKQWQYRKTISETGRKEFTVVAKNIEDRPGPEQLGEVIIQRRPLPLAEVAQVSVSPKETYAGEQFVIKALTTAAAEKVYLKIENRRYLMGGAGNEWIYPATVDRVGTSRYTLVAINADGKQGPVKEGRLNIVKRPAELVIVTKLEVNPRKGYAGEQFSFTATTDLPAKSVTMVLAGKRYTMQGSGTKWGLTRKLAERGAIDFSTIAINQDGVEGALKGGVVLVEAHPVKVVAVRTAPEAIYSGEEFVIRAQTDRPAQAVAMQMDGLTYAMQGSGKQWQYRKTIGETGKKKFSIAAKNIDDRPALAEVAKVSVSPKEVYAGEQFVIRVQTSAVADKVYVEIDGRRHSMDGAGAKWSYLTTVDRIGTSRYKVVAVNADGKSGPVREERITIAKRAAEAVSVAKLEVNPDKGYAGEKFTFKA